MHSPFALLLGSRVSSSVLWATSRLIFFSCCSLNLLPQVFKNWWLWHLISICFPFYFMLPFYLLSNYMIHCNMCSQPSLACYFLGFSLPQWHFLLSPLVIHRHSLSSGTMPSLKSLNSNLIFRISTHPLSLLHCFHTIFLWSHQHFSLLFSSLLVPTVLPIPVLPPLSLLDSLATFISSCLCLPLVLWSSLGDKIPVQNQNFYLMSLETIMKAYYNLIEK